MKHVTLRQLRTFIEVVRAGSFAGASQALHLTPPAVTLQMRELEERTGLPLVERTAAGVVPTEAGQEVIQAAQRIESVLTECADALSALRGLKGGHVSIGVVSTAKYFAPQALGAFARAHPSVEIRLEVGNRAAIIEALEANTLDLALTGRPPEDLAVDKAPIGPHPHVVVARPDHPLVAQRSLPASSLAEQTFLVRERGSGTRALMERFFTEAAIAPRIGMEMDSNETIKQAVMAGLGVAFLSAHTVAVELEDQRLMALDVAGLPVVRQWFIVRLARRRVLPAAAALREFFVNEGKAFLPTLAPRVAGATAAKRRRLASGSPARAAQRPNNSSPKRPAKRARKST